jgi:hypothetical protein
MSMLGRLAGGALVLTLAPLPALAWGSLGHRFIGELAAKNFSPAIPAFLRTPEAGRRIGELAREPDRSRGAGQPHDGERDPGHFVDGADDGSVLGGPELAALPATRQDFDTALRAVGSTQYQAGFLPYAVMDGWQQLVKDFTLWRADVAGAKFAASEQDRQWYGDDRRLRQLLTLRDLGVWAHFVGDASQPMHVSVHYNGWGDGPNPQGFVTTAGLHAKFETAFVNANITEADVAARMRPYRDCACTIQVHTETYLLATQSLVNKTYQFEKDGAYDLGAPAAKAFVAQRIAEAAAMLRDLVTDAWRASDDAVIGYTDKIVIKDIEAGKADPAILIREMRD